MAIGKRGLAVDHPDPRRPDEHAGHPRAVHLDLCEQYGNDGSGPVLVPLTQTDLAELAGATRPTVNRVLRALAAQGFVQLSRGRIVVVDPTRLAGRHAGTGL